MYKILKNASNETVNFQIMIESKTVIFEKQYKTIVYYVNKVIYYLRNRLFSNAYNLN